MSQEHEFANGGPIGDFDGDFLVHLDSSYVIPASQVEKYGKSFLEALNSGKIDPEKLPWKG